MSVEFRIYMTDLDILLLNHRIHINPRLNHFLEDSLNILAVDVDVRPWAILSR